MIRLAECCSFFSGGTPDKSKSEYWKGDIPWFSPKDMKCFDLVNAQDYTNAQATVESAARIVHSGAILVVGRSGVLAHTLPVGIVRQKSAFNQDIKAIIPNDAYDSEFMALYLKSKQSQVLLDGVKRGPTVHSVITGFIEDLEIPVIDILEQRQIAAKLKSQLAEVETARQALQCQLQEIVNLANAYIRESIESTEVVEWNLGDVLDEVKKGIGESWADYPVLGATRDGLAPAKEPPGKQPQRYKPVFSGTVFYNPMRILIGSIAFVDDDDQPGITSPDYVALQGKLGLVDSRWFYYWLRSPYGVQCINSLARGAVRERMLFNRLAEGTILLPPYQEQCRVSKALAQLKSVKSAVQQQLDDLDKIPERLLTKAFNFDNSN
ncbi:restriction endonuclease subunit S [Methylomonas rhizoryzae]|uniref:restriction endonuclease subunit S n=1 Tax=Methylomonas rhizoryzae TaxID=2608981 RepID=UPI001680CF33|nr:restriction endonuclease subunit S [Methylomonas rhizoryzae]